VAPYESFTVDYISSGRKARIEWQQTISEDTMPITSISRRHQINRRGLLVFSLLYTFLFVGAYFGWGPMQLLLEDNGSFSYKCSGSNQTTTSVPEENSDDPQGVCPSQTDSLIKIQLVGQTTQLISPLLGMTIDKYGAPTCAYIMAACTITGLVLLLIVTSLSYEHGSSHAMDLWLYPAFVFMALGTFMGSILTVQTGVSHTISLEL
jgi:hypothetical protein